MGLEPTTFELEVQHASPLRHGGFRCEGLSFYYNYFILPFFETKIFLTVFIFYTICSSIWRKYLGGYNVPVNMWQ